MNTKSGEVEHQFLQDAKPLARKTYGADIITVRPLTRTENEGGGYELESIRSAPVQRCNRRAILHRRKMGNEQLSSAFLFSFLNEHLDLKQILKGSLSVRGDSTEEREMCASRPKPITLPSYASNRIQTVVATG
jgi:hypothetical protein